MGELSGIDVLPLVREIDERLRGMYVNNVFSIGSNQIVRFRHPGGGDSWLVVSPRLGVWVSAKVAERSDTTEFTSKLRAEVERSRFVAAIQMDLDRIFDITLGEGEYLRHLIVELMPPGNIVVTGVEGKIRLILREVKSAKRRLLKGGIYQPPPQGRASPAAVTPEAVREALDREKTLGAAIGRHFALPRKYVKEVLGRLGLPESTASGGVLERAADIADTIGEIVMTARDAPWPCVAETDEGEELFVVTPKGSVVKRRAGSISELCDDLLLPAVVGEASARPTPEEEKRKEMEVTIRRLGEQERGLMEKADRLRQLAEKAGSSPTLSEALVLLGDAREGGRRAARAPASKEAVASTLFGWAKEAEKKAGEARGAADALSRKAFPKETSRKKQTKELKKRGGEWYEKFRWFFSTGGKLAIGGRDAQSNALLIKRHLEEGDTVYHADLFGSPFFVLKKGAEQTPDEILELAQATVAFSSAWKTGLGSADAYWVVKDQIGTAAPSGEFMAKGSFMIKGKKNSVAHNLVALAVGIDKEGRIVSGPEAAVAASANSYVVLVPHREKASETAKKVAKELERMEGVRLDGSLDDVLRALPSGGGKVVRRKAGRQGDKPK